MYDKEEGWMKIEVLNDIKNAEEDYKKMISEAQEKRKSTIAGAELEAENILIKARDDAEEFRKQRISEAHSQAGARYEKIISDGKDSVMILEQKGRNNLGIAVDLLVTRFREQLHVSA